MKSHQRRFSRLMLVVAGVWAAACSQPAEQSREMDYRPDDVRVLCLPGCTETDPSPSSPGVFLTSAVTPDMCFDGGSTDSDRDGLAQRCENDLAAAFAPELYYYFYDEVGREPRWAARPGLSNKVRLIYLLSYYRDAGSSAYVCGLPFAPSSCNGHNGDSEAIVLEVYYNPTTKHWILDNAQYSQHGNWQPFSRGTGTHPKALVYPGGAGDYPRVYVSEGKHANYASVTSCNNGGTLDVDTCTRVNTAARVPVGAIRNVGSRQAQLINCVYTQNPSHPYGGYGSNRYECYWSYQRFRGWVPNSVGGADSDAYTDILAEWNF